MITNSHLCVDMLTVALTIMTGCITEDANMLTNVDSNHRLSYKHPNSWRAIARTVPLSFGGGVISVVVGPNRLNGLKMWSSVIINGWLSLSLRLLHMKPWIRKARAFK